MDYTSKGEKLEMYMRIKPKIINRKCVKCKMCMSAYNVNVITIDKKSFINHNKCIGCGECVAICPNKAVSIISLKGIYNALFKQNAFKKKIVEYAYTAHFNNKNITLFL